MQVRPGCAFVLEWNLPFRNPGSATALGLLGFEKITEHSVLLTVLFQAMMYLWFFQQVFGKTLCYALLLLFGANGFPFP